MSAISKLVQTGTVSAYISQFETMVNLVPDLQEAHQVNLFLSGIRTDIQAGVRLLTPTSLSHAFELALCQEDAIEATKSFHATTNPYHQYTKHPNPISNPKPNSSNPSAANGVKALFHGLSRKKQERKRPMF
ncbi:hypothetical protein IFM89_028716 [Coptis chinensis]|uniref:Ty3 transposon capsid-like protein domain-containing protein n=1 Tax=Coptis chinensis TaxID=261450 RepID=A0A835LJN8_9MAGN|nr:hypothetical protein IFM89_028716 [Coptis chinensis]